MKRCVEAKFQISNLSVPRVLKIFAKNKIILLLFCYFIITN